MRARRNLRAFCSGRLPKGRGGGVLWGAHPGGRLCPFVRVQQRSLEWLSSKRRCLWSKRPRGLRIKPSLLPWSLCSQIRGGAKTLVL